MKYDYLVVGAGLFGSIFAYEANKIGKKVLVIDKRNHVGGNCYTENFEDYHIHKYGAHIFHTSQKYIWDYINQFTTFRFYSHRVKSFTDKKFYSMPINLITLNQLWPEVITPQDARKKIESEIIKIECPKNLEEQVLSQVGLTIYEKFIKGYTTKHWGKDPKDLPSQIIKRLPIRYNMNERYYHDSDIYEGLPNDGYTVIFKKMLENIDLELNVDFFENRSYFENLAEKIVYSGPIDKLFDYQYGKLEYRSLNFENKILDYDYQGHSVVNYPELSTKYTRIIQHKYFNLSKSNVEYITHEYSQDYNGTNEPYYPINDDLNNNKYKLYKIEAEKIQNLIIGGRLGNYRYYDMDMSIGNALSVVKKELAGN